jgi:hypothetical protein
MSRLTRVLDSQPGEITFIDVFRDALDQIKTKYGFDFRYSHFEQGADDLGRHVYLEAQEQSILDLVEDFSTPARYIIIEAATQDEVVRLSEYLEGLLPFISLQKLQQEASERMKDNPQSLIRMALGAGILSDPVSLEIIRRGLADKDEIVRFRAAAAASLTQWIDFQEDVKSLSQNDSSPEVRAMASKAVEACQRRLKL